MNITFAPRDILQIDDARIIFRNFAGAPTKFNPKGGARDFALVISDEDLADQLEAAGWNIKSLPPIDDGDMPLIYMKVKIAFNDFGPVVYLRTGTAMNKLEEEDVAILDNIEIENVDLDIRPYDWEVNGKTGRTAYLQSICVTQKTDRYADKYGMED